MPSFTIVQKIRCQSICYLKRRCYFYFISFFILLAIDKLYLFYYDDNNNFGIVVQLVRAPPCHGGSCEFESRQSRLIKLKKTNTYYYIFNNNIQYYY
jgi:hypothetical protein